MLQSSACMRKIKWGEAECFAVSPVVFSSLITVESHCCPRCWPQSYFLHLKSCFKLFNAAVHVGQPISFFYCCSKPLMLVSEWQRKKFIIYFTFISQKSLFCHYIFKNACLFWRWTKTCPCSWVPPFSFSRMRRLVETEIVTWIYVFTQPRWLCQVKGTYGREATSTDGRLEVQISAGLHKLGRGFVKYLWTVFH